MKGFTVTKHTTRANGYCGPAALSAITGRTVEEVVGVLHSYLVGFRRVRGLHHGTMEAALSIMGYDAVPAQVKTPDAFHYPTLAAWLRRPRDPKDVYLVAITGHYLVVRGRKIVDNHWPNGVFLRRYPRRRARVRWVRRVTKQGACQRMTGASGSQSI